MSQVEVVEEKDLFDLKSKLISLLESEKYEEAKLVVQDDKYSGAICNIITELGDIIIEDKLLKKHELFNFCSWLVCWIAERSDPNDSLVEFITLAESSKDLQFYIMLRGMEISVTKSIHKGGQNEVMWCLNTIIRHINDMEKIEDLNLEDGEYVIQENSEACLKICETYKEIFEFLKPIMSYLFKYDTSSTAMGEVGNSVLTFLIKLLGRPLIYIDLRKRETKSDFQLLAEKILNHIIMFKLDLTHFLNFVLHYNPRRKTTTYDIIDLDFHNLPLGTMYYLVFSEEIAIDSIAHVYNPIFLFESISTLVVDMLVMDHSVAQMKGLYLFESILKRISSKSLNLSNVNGELFGNICKSLSYIMVYSQLRENRKIAADVFKDFLMKFDSQGRHYILYNIQNEIKESKFIGHVAKLAQDFIAGALNDRDPKDLEYFTGSNLCNMLSKFCTLHKGVQTDLLEISDQIICSLNLVRFILLRDKENSGITYFIPELNNYLSSLKTGLELSIAHYKLERDNLIDGRTELESDILPKHLSSSQKLEIINLALTTFDLIQSLEVRVEECLALK